MLIQNKLDHKFKELSELYRMNHDLSECDDFMVTLKELSNIFKIIGAVRPYYTCEKIFEAYLDLKISHNINRETCLS